MFCEVPKDVENRQNYEYTWTKEGKVITKSRRFKIRNLTFLKIRSVTVEDAGSYKCVVKNSYGSDSLTFQVHIYCKFILFLYLLNMYC